MTRARVVFAGTPPFSVRCLDALVERGEDIVAVYCQPDRPAGRGRASRACAVKLRAESLGLPVRQPISLRDDAEAAGLRALGADIMVVVAYGLLLPAPILDAPRLGCVNVHASLLPRWRGAAPIQRAIAAGDAQTGVTLMRMDEGLDTGPMLARTQTAIAGDETGASLHERLSRLGADLLAGEFGNLVEKHCHSEPQDESRATYAPKIDTAEAVIDWNDQAAAIERRVRAFDPWPVCRTQLGGADLRVYRAQVGERAAGAAPGTVLACGRNGIDVACADHVLRLVDVQKSGGRRMPAGEFLNGTPVAPGQVLGVH